MSLLQQKMVPQSSEDRANVPVFARVTDAMSGKIKPLCSLPVAHHIQQMPGLLLGYHLEMGSLDMAPALESGGFAVVLYPPAEMYREIVRNGQLGLATNKAGTDYLRYVWVSNDDLLLRGIEREGGREHYQDVTLKYEDLLFYPPGIVVQTFVGLRAKEPRGMLSVRSIR